jgi:hypothetical protein
MLNLFVFAGDLLPHLSLGEIVSQGVIESLWVKNKMSMLNDLNVLELECD